MHSSWNFLKREATEMLERSMGWPGRRFPANPLRVFAMSRDRVRVVILGQDPYPNNKATGLAFAVPEWCSTPPASLKNIAKEIEKDTGYPLRDLTLSHWENQGVFLLNTCLTVGETPGSHLHRGWEHITATALNSLEGVVVLAFGHAATTFSNRHAGTSNTVLSTSHPSPLSAHRGFIGSKIFSRANKFINGATIQWGNRYDPQPRPTRR